jgi:hypothetical protein
MRIQACRAAWDQGGRGHPRGAAPRTRRPTRAPPHSMCAPPRRRASRLPSPTSASSSTRTSFLSRTSASRAVVVRACCPSPSHNARCCSTAVEHDEEPPGLEGIGSDRGASAARTDRDSCLELGEAELDIPGRLLLLRASTGVHLVCPACLLSCSAGTQRSCFSDACTLHTLYCATALSNSFHRTRAVPARMNTHVCSSRFPSTIARRDPSIEF